MNKFETIPIANDLESEESARLAKLWRRFNFPFNPPKPGSPAEQRLIKNCEDYTKFSLDPDLFGASGSNGHRRELHNALTSMILGQSRESTDTELAEEIADFACYVTTGTSLQEMLKEISKSKN